jgi:hypothetical protein
LIAGDTKSLINSPLSLVMTHSLDVTLAGAPNNAIAPLGSCSSRHKKPLDHPVVLPRRAERPGPSSFASPLLYTRVSVIHKHTLPACITVEYLGNWGDEFVAEWRAQALTRRAAS